MTDFVIVVAAVAAVASAAAPGSPAAVPDRAPTVGFRTYPGVAACEEAITRLAPRLGSRFFCLPVELPPGGLVSAC